MGLRFFIYCEFPHEQLKQINHHKNVFKTYKSVYNYCDILVHIMPNFFRDKYLACISIDNVPAIHVLLYAITISLGYSKSS